MPTAAEARQAISRSRYNIDGGLRTIYDPYTTKFNPTTGAVSRTPFPGNKIPVEPLRSARCVADERSSGTPNSPGDNITRVTTSKRATPRLTTTTTSPIGSTTTSTTSGRSYGRIGRYHTTTWPERHAEQFPTVCAHGNVCAAAPRSRAMPSGPSARRTVVNFHGDWHKLIDAYVSASLGTRRMGLHLAQQ